MFSDFETRHNLPPKKLEINFQHYFNPDEELHLPLYSL